MHLYELREAILENALAGYCNSPLLNGLMCISTALVVDHGTEQISPAVLTAPACRFGSLLAIYIQYNLC